MTETEAKMVRDVGAAVCILGLAGTAWLVWMNGRFNSVAELGFDPNQTFKSSVAAALAARDSGCQLGVLQYGEIDKRAAEGNPMRRRDLEAACGYTGTPDNYRYYWASTETRLPLGRFDDQMFAPDGSVIGTHTHELQGSTEKCAGFGEACMFNRWILHDTKGAKPMGGTLYRALNSKHERTLRKNPGFIRR